LIKAEPRTSFSYRTFLKTRKPYPSITLAELHDERLAKTFDPSSLRTGEAGIYLGIYPEARIYWGHDPDLYDDIRWIWLILDIDGEAKRIASAIERSHRIHENLRKSGLLPHFNWLLSGSGLRAVSDFLISFSLRDGLLEYLSSLKRDGLGVDPGPYSDIDKGGHPIRLLSYRGHPNQCQDASKIIDRHTVLIDDATLLSLDEKTYLDLTAGRPDPDEYHRWTRQILPAVVYDKPHGLPAEIERFLDTLRSHERDARLRKAIQCGSPFLRPVRRVNLEKIFEFLDELDISYRQIEHPHVWSLSPCPMCGRKDGHAWITEVGRLKCFAETCEASWSDGGLPPSKWVDEKFLDGFTDDESEVEEPVPSFVDLEFAERALREHLGKDGNLAVAVTPGVGKTKIAIEKALSLAAKEIVIYAMPEHALIEEWIKRIESEDTSTSVTHFKGRLKGTCLRPTKIEYLSSQGYYPSQTVCFGCKHHPRRSAHAEKCRYYEQFEEITAKGCGLIFCSTHQLPYLVKNNDLGKIGTIFIDEQALHAIVAREKGVPITTFISVTPHLSPEARTVVEKIRNTAERLHHLLVLDTKASGGRLYTIDPEGTWWRGKTGMWDLAEASEEERTVLRMEVENLLSRSQYDLYDRRINRKALLWLDAALHDNQVAWIQATKDSANPITLNFIRKWSLPKKTRLVVLDATTSNEELTALFDRDFDLLNLHVAWTGTRIHINHAMGKRKKLATTDEQFARRAAVLKGLISEPCMKWLVCTHKADKDKTLKRLKEHLPEIEWSSSHYFAERGRNEYETMDGVFAYGLPIWNPTEMHEFAACLFPGDVKQQLRWVQQQNDAELYQKVHRIRMVRHPGKTVIVEGHRWPPILGRPDKVIDLTRSPESSLTYLELALPVFDALGFFDLQIAALVGIATTKTASKIAEVRAALEPVLAAAVHTSEEHGKVYHPLLKLLIKVDTPEVRIFSTRNQYKFLLSGIRSWTGADFFEVKLPAWGHSWSYGIGSITKAEDFYRGLSEIAAKAGLDMKPYLPTGWRPITEEETTGAATMTSGDSADFPGDEFGLFLALPWSGSKLRIWRPEDLCWSLFSLEDLALKKCA